MWLLLLQRNKNAIKMNDSAYTLHLEPANKKNKTSRFQKGNIPWNKGLSWEEQGIVGEEAKKRKA